jgi:hypothetical protein
VPIVLKSGSLNLLEPSGPVKACNGIGLPFRCGLESSGSRGKWQAVVNVVMNIQVPYNVGNFLTGWGTVSFSKRYVLRRVGY